MGDLREPGSADSVNESSASTSASQSNPTLSSIGEEKWVQAELSALQIMSLVQPTFSSEEKRKSIINYIHKLITGTHSCKVFPFGSVPLKTYLPDGDIDLSAFCGTSSDDILVSNMVAVLEREAQSDAAEFCVKDVQLIPAEVKLVKCIIQNIVVDISFNQLGGLYTLCFLEQIDRFIGKDHLFKRSIILIKAWCFHESRVLGAHHGLISTYALETLVLYIFHHFHSTLDGPLSVLYKFLDYFSKFDWEHYCVSLFGPARLSSFPQIIAEKPENGVDEVLLSDDIVKQIFGTSIIPLGNQNARMFPRKHMNIVDPLKENNNLGRSISKGNFFRIQCAFTHGAKTLGRILSGQQANIAEEMSNFFSTTLGRHGTGLRLDAQDSASISDFITDGDDEVRNNSLGFSNLSGDIESQFKSLNFARWCCESAQTGPVMLVPISRLHSRGGPRDVVTHIPFRPEFYEMSQNMAVPRNALYRANPMLVPPGTTFLVEEMMPKSRGTGTYFPNNGPPYIPGNGRHPQGHARFAQNVHVEPNFHERGNFAVHSSSRYGHTISDAQVYPHMNAVYPQGPVGFVQQGIWQPRPQIAHAGPQSSPRGQDSPQLRPVIRRQDRLAESSSSSSYRLKNDDDFPPLSM
ncbi:uncharacterized protein LOC124938674 isoform X2 [Impatiens glandulifera]|uniref:uncharacterized protein LOC124938674 isoform X2 n=1 Tax=Impatiens glandulifera TaxID=253017 RepID=UPI001FB0E986|nr:uncharacterized protein LOC124938674 isoform X2 [Impatiens glandulifera]